MKNLIIKIFSMVLIGIIIGMMFSGQFRSKASRNTNPAYSYAELEAVKKQYSDRRDELKASLESIKNDLKKEQDQLAQSSEISGSLLADLDNQKKLAGLIAVQGEGLEISLADGSKAKGSNEDRSIAHAADLRDLVNVLWRAGALSITINNERIVYNTSIDCIVNTILINSSRQAPPFKILAFGNAQKMAAAADNATELNDLRSRKSKNQVAFEVTKKDQLSLPAYDGSFSVKFAKAQGE